MLVTEICPLQQTFLPDLQHVFSAPRYMHSTSVILYVLYASVWQILMTLVAKSTTLHGEIPRQNCEATVRA